MNGFDTHKNILVWLIGKENRSQTPRRLILRTEKLKLSWTLKIIKERVQRCQWCCVMWVMQSMTLKLSSVNPSRKPSTLSAVTSRAKVLINDIVVDVEINNLLPVEVLKTVIKDSVMSPDMQEAVDTIQYVLGMIIDQCFKQQYMRRDSKHPPGCSSLLYHIHLEKTCCRFAEAQSFTSMVTQDTLKTSKNITWDSRACALKVWPSQPGRTHIQKYNIDDHFLYFSKPKINYCKV